MWCDCLENGWGHGGQEMIRWDSFDTSSSKNTHTHTLTGKLAWWVAIESPMDANLKHSCVAKPYIRTYVHQQKAAVRGSLILNPCKLT